MSLSPTTAEIKIKELLLLEIQSNCLSKYTSRTASRVSYLPYGISPKDKLLFRLKARDVLSFSSDSNRVLQAFSFLLLQTIYGDCLNEYLLNTIKVKIYRDELDLTSIVDQPLDSLSNLQMKKFFAEFAIQLYFTDFQAIFFKKISKFTVIIDIMVLFLRCLLVELGIKEAQCYETCLPTDIVIELLSDFFDLNFRRTKNSFLFIQNSLFLYELNSEETILGTYGDQNHKKSIINPETKPQDRIQGEWKRSSLGRKVEETSEMKQSNLMGSNAPTPEFNLGGKINKERGRNSNDLSIYPQSNSPFGKIKSFQDIISDQYLIQSNVPQGNTPSVRSIQEILQTLSTPVNTANSPTSPLCFNSKNTTLNQFESMINHSEHLFIKQNKDKDPFSKDYFSNCFCKEIARQNLRLNSNLYQITLGSEGDSLKKSKNVFKGKYKFRKLSEMQFKKNETQGSKAAPPSTTRTKNEAESPKKDTNHSFYSLQAGSESKEDSQYLKRPVTQTSRTSTNQSPRFVFSKNRIKFNYVNKQ